MVKRVKWVRNAIGENTYFLKYMIREVASFLAMTMFFWFFDHKGWMKE